MSEPIPVPTPDGVQAAAVPLESSIAPGWFPDPGMPGFERRWDGSAWVGTPHKAPNPNALFGANYARAYWFNANRILHVTRIAGIVSVLALVTYVIVASSSTTLEQPRGVLALIASGGVIAGVAAIATGGSGIAQARRLGALAPAITMVVGNVIITLLNLVFLAFVTLTVTYAS